MKLWRNRILLLAATLLTGLVGAGCDDPAGVDASTTTSGDETGSPAPTDPPTTPLTLVPYTNPLFGLQTVVPNGWTEEAEWWPFGMLRPPGEDDATTILAFLFLTGTGRDVFDQLESLLQPLEPLQANGRKTAADLSWEFFHSTSKANAPGGRPIDVKIGVTESGGGVHVVLLTTPPDDELGLTESVFEPAVEAFVVPEAIDGPMHYLDSTAPIDQRVEDLVGRMNLLEKIGQMTLVEKDSIAHGDIAALGIGGLLSGGGGSPLPNTPEAWADMTDAFQQGALASRLGIPLLYGADAVHGHNNVMGAVVFPHNIGLGAAGDPALVGRVARITATEGAATGVFWNFAPVLAVPQDLRWGRTYEAYGEDPELVASLGSAFIAGLHGQDLADRPSMLSTPKHYLADGGTAWGSSTSFGYAIDQGVARIDEETLRAIHLPPFEAAVKAGALSVMASFSSWDGLKMHAQRYLLTDVLKQELSFEGFVVSDWAGIDQVSNDYPEAVVTSINAGIDMNMVPVRYREFMATLADAVDRGDVPLERIDDSVRRILRAKFALGLFERPLAERGLLDSVGSAEHRGVAREAVGRSVVLLKNERATLPISAQEIFVGGRAAADVGIQSGGWTIEWQGGIGGITPGTTIVDGIVDGAPSGTVVYHDRFGRLDRVESSDGDLDPDLCLAVVGERPYAEGRGDVFEPEIEDQDLAVLANMEEACDRLGVILVAGRPLLIADQMHRWDALVMAWLPGTEGGGVADVLYGSRPFTGRLPLTWPRTVEQLPLGTSNIESPLFPIGFGLAATRE